MAKTLHSRTATPAAPRWLQRRRRPPEFIPGKIVVRFKSDVLQSAIPAVTRGVQSMRSVLPEQVNAPLEFLKRECGLLRIDALFAAPRRLPRTGHNLRLGRQIANLVASVEHSTRERLRGYNIIELETKNIPRDILKRINASEAVEFVERVPNRWTSSLPSAADPGLNMQWGLRAIEWFSIKERPDASGVHVAVLDTGVDAVHPDLKGVIAAYDHGKHSAKDLPGHGTHVAGILAASTNNGIGISGVANCRLHVWKVFSDPKGPGKEEEFDDETYNRALVAVLDSPARIVNLSLGGTQPSQTEQNLIAALVEEGILVVAAMGNEYGEGNPIEWPAAYDNVLAVGAIAENRRRATFSNTGRHIGVVAPGNNILSTLPHYGYFGRTQTDFEAWPGTSMAAPHVAGCAALVKAKYSAKDGAWIAERLQRTAVTVPAMGGKAFTQAYGHGLVSAARALI